MRTLLDYTHEPQKQAYSPSAEGVITPTKNVPGEQQFFTASPHTGMEGHEIQCTFTQMSGEPSMQQASFETLAFTGNINNLLVEYKIFLFTQNDEKLT